MKTDSNPEWIQKFNSNVGEITMLVPPTKPPAVTGLRRPYQYELTTANARGLIDKLKAIGRRFKEPLVQCVLVDSKLVKYGCRLNIFFLGYRPGYCGNDGTGITAQQWQEITTELDRVLKASLPDAALYMEPWISTDKFQARFETYILFTELKS